MRKPIPGKEQPENRAVLQVYVASHCANCEEAQRLAQVVSQLFPHLRVDVIDVDQTETESSEVFAVPTYVLNNRVCFLGNPSQEELCDLLKEWIELDEPSPSGRISAR